MAAKETLDPDGIVAQADREIREAEDLADTLEARVREGDDTITYEQVEKARGLSRFARLRKEAAEKKAAALAEKLAREEFDAFLAEHLAGAQGRDEKVDAFLAQARELIEKAVEVSLEHDQHVYALAARAGTRGNAFHPEDDPELIGDAQLPELAWFQARGVHMRVLAAGGVLKRLLRPYARDLQLSAHSDLGKAIQ